MTTDRDHAALKVIPVVGAPMLRHLVIKRFRGFSDFSWYPAPGSNILLGGGDVRKTTVLEAVALLLNPTNAYAPSDVDYFERRVEEGFVIEAVISLPGDSGINEQLRPAWPWQWNGAETVVPSVDAETESGEPVYRLRLRGTPELELVYEVVRPDGEADGFTVALRRGIGLVRLGGDDRSDRDLRLVHGSALDRLLSDRALRSRIASKLADTNVEAELLQPGKEALDSLNQGFAGQGLPTGLGLSLTSSSGLSVGSLIGLTALRDDVELPLTSWGAGTRRLSALAIAAHNQRESPITVVDEIERGLEPYRQRALIQKLQTGHAQVFVTTHSPSVIAAGSQSHFWYVDHRGRIGPLEAAATGRHRESDPYTFLAWLAIVAEGKSEVGFVSVMLEKALGARLVQYGIHVSDGGGHDNALALLESFAVAGVAFGGFADNEGRHPDRWRRVELAQGPLVFRWQTGCLEENVIGAVADNALEALTVDPASEETGMRLRSLADRLRIQDKTFSSLRAAAGGGLKDIIIQAAMGAVPDGTPRDEERRYKSHGQIWFKTIEGGEELARKVFTLGLWPLFSARLLPFCNAVRGTVGLDPVADIQP